MTSWVKLADRAVLRVAGPEAKDLLQRIVTNDMDRVTDTEAMYAALLTPQGKYLFDFFVLQVDDGYLLDCNGEQAAALLKRLTMYRLRADVQLADVSENYQVGAIYAGDGLPVGDGVFDDPRDSRLGQRAILPVDADLDGVDQGDREDYEELRISLAVPSLAGDLLSEKSTPLEVNFEHLNAIDFDKGCYVGQEVTARMKHRATLRKRLLPVRFDGAAPPPGTAITIGDREVGQVGSSVGDRALALLRLDRLQDGGELVANGVALQLDEAPSG